MIIIDYSTFLPLIQASGRRHGAAYKSINISECILGTWLSGFFIELHPDAYRDIFLHLIAIYLLIAVGFLIRNKYKR